MAADLVFVNGPVFTSSASRPIARAVAVERERVVAVGGEGAVVDLVGPGTEVVDLAGRMLTPGFCDAHVHPAQGGLQLGWCDLGSAVDAISAYDLVAGYASDHPDEAWIRGGGWSYTWFPGGTPSADALDSATGDRPAYLVVSDGHSAWVNRAALAAAGVDAATGDPPDGRIERNPDGSPQGTLHEGAMGLVERVLPPVEPTRLQRGLEAGQRHLLSMGVTAWQDAWVTEEIEAAYRALAGDGRLIATVRAALWWDRERGIEQVDELVERSREGVGRFHPGTVKLMLDGVCENFTASLLEPYDDGFGGRRDDTGIDFIDPDLLPEIVTRLDRAGLQCHFHAIGDAAARNALDAVQAARAENGWSDLRHHVAHIQVVDPADVPRFRTLGVVANAQPVWACHESAMDDLTLPFLGEERAASMYPFGGLHRSGAVLAMGSDWPVSTAAVLPQVAVATSRIPPGRPDVAPFHPEQAVSMAVALTAFTAGSAFVSHLDHDRGTIEVGKRADLVVLSEDPFQAEDPAAVVVDLTVVDGVVVHRA
jgi:hypothetical protein